MHKTGKRIFMNYVVLDLEWNQSTDKTKTELKELPFEIVEIGAVLLDASFQAIGEFSRIVKPSVYLEMNEYTGKLIHLQMSELKKGRPFPEVMKEFLNWCGDEYIFCTWGSQDLVELQRNMDYYHMPALSKTPFAYLDVQKLFNIACTKDKIQRALEYAVDYLHIPQDIPFHRAFSDAFYTSEVLKQLPESVLSNQSYDTYHPPKSRREEIHVRFSDYYKYISRCFPTKERAMQDSTVTSTYCYICNRRLPRLIRWFSANSRHFYSVSICDTHGYMKGKIRMKHASNGKIYVVKTQKFITKEEVDAIYDKLAHIRALRKEKQSGNL